MFRALTCVLLAAVATIAADGDWSKVKALKTGQEIRVFKKGSAQPVLAQMDELTDDNLIVIEKKSQTAIPRNQIDRIEARPVQTGSRVKGETTTKDTFPDAKSAANTNGRGPDRPGSSTTTNVTFSKPDFETVFRRSPGAPKK